MKNITSIIAGLLLTVAVLIGCKTAPHHKPTPSNVLIPPLPANTFPLGGPSPRTNLFAIQIIWLPVAGTNISNYGVYCGSNSISRVYTKRFITTNTLNYFGTNCTVFIDRLSPTNIYRFALTARNPEGLESDYSVEVNIPLLVTNIITVTSTPQINTNGDWVNLVTNLTLKIVNPTDNAFFRTAVHITDWDANNTVSITAALQQTPNVLTGTWTELTNNISFVLGDVPVSAQLGASLDISRWNNQGYQKSTNGVPTTIPIFHLQ